MDNQVRVFRENPIAWVEKQTTRYLREKYGKNKRLFVSLHGVYLALCEVQSDFTDLPIRGFSKTVGAYAGVSRGVAGKCINILIEEGFITRTRVRDEKTNRFLTGTIIEIKSFKSIPAISDPVSRIPDSGDPQQRRSPTEGIADKYKKIGNSKNIFNAKKINNNVVKKNHSWEEASYYADLLADKLGDRGSITYFRQVCMRHNPQELVRKAQEIIADGHAKNPAAVFASWVNTL